MSSALHSANFNDFFTHRFGPPADFASALDRRRGRIVSHGAGSLLRVKTYSREPDRPSWTRVSPSSCRHWPSL
jgi:hypothetical protein